MPSRSCIPPDWALSPRSGTASRQHLVREDAKAGARALCRGAPRRAWAPLRTTAFSPSSRAGPQWGCTLLSSLEIQSERQLAQELAAVLDVKGILRNCP